MRRVATWTSMLCLLGAIAAPAAAADSNDGNARTAHFTSLVGAQTQDQGIQALAFLPNDITVDVGDSITWNFPTQEPHTLTFVQPGQPRPPASLPASPNNSTFDGKETITSGTLLGGATYSVTFGAPGDFQFVCLIHSRMSGTIHVQAAGAARVQDVGNDDGDNSSLVAAGREQGDALLAEGAQLERQEQQAVRSDTDAVRIGSGFVFTTGAGDQSVMIARFLPGTRTIHVGDSIDWTATDPATPHTVTFGPKPANPAGIINATPTGAVLPTTPPGLTVSSGFLGEPFGREHYSVTFNAPGTYQYYCALHQALGMVGTIVVTS